MSVPFNQLIELVRTNQYPSSELDLYRPHQGYRERDGGIFVDLDEPNITKEQWVALCEAFALNTIIKKIEFAPSYQCMPPEALHALFNSLKTNNNIQNVYLYNNKIGPELGMELAEMLKVNTGLKKLTISDNHMGTEVGIAIAEALKTHPSLEILNADLTCFSDWNPEHGSIKDQPNYGKVGRAFAETIKVNNVLKELDLSFEYLLGGNKELLEAFRLNTTMTKFVFQDQYHPENSEIQSILAHNANLQNFKLEIAEDIFKLQIDDEQKNPIQGKEIITKYKSVLSRCEELSTKYRSPLAANQLSDYATLNLCAWGDEIEDLQVETQDSYSLQMNLSQTNPLQPSPLQMEQNSNEPITIQNLNRVKILVKIVVSTQDAETKEKALYLLSLTYETLAMYALMNKNPESAHYLLSAYTCALHCSQMKNSSLPAEMLSLWCDKNGKIGENLENLEMELASHNPEKFHELQTQYLKICWNLKLTPSSRFEVYAKAIKEQADSLSQGDSLSLEEDYPTEDSNSRPSKRIKI